MNIIGYYIIIIRAFCNFDKLLLQGYIINLSTVEKALCESL